ncbi:MAG: M48 family metallopeptidase [Sphingomonadales bacterium]|nr:M48 family metallopeptidase [Sphingomonadales bacterium]
MNRHVLPWKATLALALAAMPAAGRADAVVAGPDADRLERGLMMSVDEAERKFRDSPLIIRDPALNGYVRSVLCKLEGPAKCAAVRLYLVRTPDFNANMAPNGAMQVWSGLLLRTRNEAQLAAVLGHEYAHYEKRHTLALYRELKSKSASAAWLAMTGVGLIAAIAMESDFFRYSREMEREADLAGVEAMATAGYDTREAARVWEQLREEMDATAAARGTTSRKDKDKGLFGSHPPSAERVAYLIEEAGKMPGRPGENGLAAYRAGLGPWWQLFIDDQLKRNDFGAAEYLLGQLAASGWTAELLCARGELFRRRGGVDDLARAEGFYAEAVDKVAAPAECWRGRGLARLKLGREAEGRADVLEYLRRAPDASDRAMMQMMAGGTR